MKVIDYINSLIKERDKLKELCKSHVETIRLLKRDLMKKDKKIQKNENTTSNTNLQKELDNIKSELDSLRVNYEDLKNMYECAVEENEELKSILDEIERMCDSDFENNNK